MHIVLSSLILLASSYGAMAGRDIKALSPADVQALQEGQGMGLALAAELNHHPGPKHVLELAETLKLSTEQMAAVKRVHKGMNSSAVLLGKEIIELERALDEAFAAAAIDEARLQELTAAIAERQGRLRYVHLAAHLTTRAALLPGQIKAYDAARGYHSGGATSHQHHHD